MVPRFSKHVVTITNGTSVSGAIPVGNETIMAISSASNGGSWVAAVLAFEWSPDDGSTWLSVVDDGGTEVSIASAQVAAAIQRLMVNATIIAKLAALGGKVRLASGPNSARVNQSAIQQFTIITKTP